METFHQILVIINGIFLICIQPLFEDLYTLRKVVRVVGYGEILLGVLGLLNVV